MNGNNPYQTQLAVNKSKRSMTSRRAVTSPATAKKTQTTYRKKKPVAKMFFFGAVSLAAYGVLLSNEALVTNTYTLGGWYAVLPVGTAFAFSFFHGAFASNLLNVLGLEPKKA